MDGLYEKVLIFFLGAVIGPVIGTLNTLALVLSFVAVVVLMNGGAQA